MNVLYPLKFKPIIKEKIWGSDRLKKKLNKQVGSIEKAGESWEISNVEGNLSVVENGFLEGNNIEELIEVYMGDLVGDAVYDKFGIMFPLLVKFIDANEYLSIQVHPDDEMALEKHNSYGKTEMWYVVDADKNAELIIGFNQSLNKQKYLLNFEAGTLRDVLNFENAKTGDVFFIPAGRIHSTGPGILFAEIQQTSDATYRVDDWGRLGDDGKPRELHTDLAVEALDFDFHKNYKIDYELKENESCNAVQCDYFTTNVIALTKTIEKDYNWLDSFVIYMVTKGDVELTYGSSEKMIIKQGETVLIPAVLNFFKLKPLSQEVRLLEVYIH